MTTVDTSPLPHMVQLELWGWHCKQCTHDWVPRSATRTPKECPKCRSRFWNVPPEAEEVDGQPVLSLSSGEGAPAPSVNDNLRVTVEGASPVPPSTVTADGEVIDPPAELEVRAHLSRVVAHLSPLGAGAYVEWAWAQHIPTSMNRLTARQAERVTEWLREQPDAAFADAVPA